LLRDAAKRHHIKSVHSFYVKKAIRQRILAAGFVSVGSKQLKVIYKGQTQFQCPKCSRAARRLFYPDLMCWKCSGVHKKRYFPKTKEGQAFFYLQRAMKCPTKKEHYYQIAQRLLKQARARVKPQRRK